MRGALVIAGGPSRRIGRPKALVPVGGVPLVARVVGAASKVAGEVIVAAKRTYLAPIERAVPKGTRVLVDAQDVQSPLVGLVTAARAASSEYVAYLACDLPFLQPALLRALFSEAKGKDGAIPEWPDGRIEPMVAVYRRTPALEAALEALQAGERANTDMIDRLLRVVYVPTDALRRADPGLDSFFNVNTPEDLARAEALAAPT